MRRPALVRRPIYVEIAMRTPIDEVWRRSQDPADHSRWDLRFSRIEMLDPTTVRAGVPRPFRYAVGPVTGVGVTSADRRLSDGSATSALRFSSDHRLSPIRSGSGYWRYVPHAGGTTFVTRYDYVARGPWDRLVRPLLGWATAWSFDRLRLWVDEGITPERSRLRALLEVVARLAVGGVGARVAVAAYGSLGAPMSPIGPRALCTTGIALLLSALVVPPHRLTPSARRCRRHPVRPARPAAALQAARPTPEVLP